MHPSDITFKADSRTRLQTLLPTGRIALSKCGGTGIAGELTKRKYEAMKNPKRDKP
jgi:hypothetical protein